MRYFPILLFLLLLHNVSATFSQTNKDSLLIEAIKAGKIDEAKKLVGEGADVDAVDENGATALMWAAYSTDLPFVKWLVEKGVDYRKKGLLYDKYDSEFGNILGIAATFNKLDIIKYLIEDKGVDINDKEISVRSPDGWTAIQYSLWFDNKDVTNYLLSKNAIIDYLTLYEYGYKKEAVKYILTASYSGNKKDSLLHEAFNNCYDEIFQLLLELGANINSLDIEGNTLLNKAVLLESMNKVSFLIKNGADPNIVDSDGYSPLGLLSSDEDSLIKKYLMSNGANIVKSKTKESELSIQTGHPYYVSSIDVDNDQKYIISGGYAGNIILWDLHSLKEIMKIKLSFDAISEVKFHPNGKLVAICGNDYNITLIDLNTRKILIKLHGLDYFNSISFDETGKYLCASSSMKIYLWNMDSLKRVTKIEYPDHLHHNWIYDAKIDSKGKNIISGHHNGEIRIWDIKSNNLAFNNKLFNEPVYSVDIDSKSRLYIACTESGKVKTISMKNSKTINEFCNNTSGLLSCELSRNGKFSLCTYKNNEFELYDLTNITSVLKFNNSSSGYFSSCFLPDNNSFLLGTFDSKMEIWDVVNKSRSILKTGKIGIQAFGLFSPDHKTLIATSPNKSPIFWDLQGGKLLTKLPLINPSLPIIFNSDNSKVLFGGISGNISIMDFDSKRVEKSIQAHQSLIFSIDESSNSQYFATGGYDSKINLWNNDFSELMKSFDSHKSMVYKIKFNSDNKLLASGSATGVIKTWDLANYEEMKSVSGHTGAVTSLSFSNNGKYLASGSMDHTIKIWDSGTMKLIQTFSWKVTNAIIPLTGVHNIYWDDRNENILCSNLLGMYVVFNIESGERVPIDKKLLNWIKEQISPYLLKTDLNSIYFIDVETGKDVIRLIQIDSTDWAVVTPDGKFDASPNGRKLMYYVKDMKPITLEAFMENYYTPGLLKLVMDGDYVPDEERGEILFPPEIEILSPDINEVIDKDLLQLKVMLTDEGGGIDEIRLYQNGKLIEEKTFGFEPGLVPQIPFNFNVSLLPGKNEFKVSAFGSDRTENTMEFYLELDNKVIPEYSAESDLYIVAIGINKY